MSVPRLRSQKLLGLSIGEQSILLAEVHSSGAGHEVRRMAEFRYPEGSLPAQLGALGRPLAAFLRKQGFGARHAVVGIPARWVLVRSKEIPPADAATAAGILRVQAEGEFSAELKDLTYDYAGRPDRQRATTVLLMAASRSRLAEIDELALGAGLIVEGVTPSVAALAVASRELVSPQGLVVYLGKSSAELALQSGMDLQRMRHIGGLSDQPPATATVAATPIGTELVGEFRRTFAGLPQNGSSSSSRKMVLWDGSGMDEAVRRGLGERLGLPWEAASLGALGVTGQITAAQAGRYAPAVALALAAYGDALPVDFAHTRLAPPQQSTMRRKIAWASAVAGLVLLSAGALVFDAIWQAREVQGLKAKLVEMRPRIDEANAKVEQFNFSQRWRTGDPRFLDCLLALTKAFPDDGSVWAINIEIPESLNGTLTAKATSGRGVTSLTDRLRTSGKFKDVRSPQQETGRSSEISFTVKFTYTGKE